MSGLRAAGQTEANRWPLARVWAEGDLLRERQADAVRESTVGVYQAGVAIMAGMGGKAAASKATRSFNEWLKGLG